MKRGVYMPCSQYEALFVSAAHTEADIDATITAAEAALRELADGPRTMKATGSAGGLR
jgi:glutamate-1-semialdehyde 2,1-aminomutase